MQKHTITNMTNINEIRVKYKKIINEQEKLALIMIELINHLEEENEKLRSEIRAMRENQE